MAFCTVAAQAGDDGESEEISDLLMPKPSLRRPPARGRHASILPDYKQRLPVSGRAFAGTHQGMIYWDVRGLRVLLLNALRGLDGPRPKSVLDCRVFLAGPSGGRGRSTPAHLGSLRRGKPNTSSPRSSIVVHEQACVPSRSPDQRLAASHCQLWRLSGGR